MTLSEIQYIETHMFCPWCGFLGPKVLKLSEMLLYCKRCNTKYQLKVKEQNDTNNNNN